MISSCLLLERFHPFGWRICFDGTWSIRNIRQVLEILSLEVSFIFLKIFQLNWIRKYLQVQLFLSNFIVRVIEVRWRSVLGHAYIRKWLFIFSKRIFQAAGAIFFIRKVVIWTWIFMWTFKESLLSSCQYFSFMKTWVSYGWSWLISSWTWFLLIICLNHNRKVKENVHVYSRKLQLN